MASEKLKAAARENGKKGGRKRGLASIQAEKARDILVTELMKSWRPIVVKAIEQAVAGDASARAWLKDNGFGKALEQLALVDPDDALKQILIGKSYVQNSKHKSST